MLEDAKPSDPASREQIALVQTVVNAIYSNDYYVGTWQTCGLPVRFGVIQPPITIGDLLRPFQTFWERLPDGGSIRRVPFFGICDLAEAYTCLSDAEFDENDGSPDHDLKILPEFFKAVQAETKTFELRMNDRDFNVGDVVKLSEYDGSMYTGDSLTVRITYVFEGTDYGLESGFCIFSFEII